MTASRLLNGLGEGHREARKVDSLERGRPRLSRGDANAAKADQLDHRPADGRLLVARVQLNDLVAYLETL